MRIRIFNHSSGVLVGNDSVECPPKTQEVIKKTSVFDYENSQDDPNENSDEPIVAIVHAGTKLYYENWLNWCRGNENRFILFLSSEPMSIKETYESCSTYSASIRDRVRGGMVVFPRAGHKPENFETFVKVLDHTLAYIQDNKKEGSEKIFAAVHSFFSSRWGNFNAGQSAASNENMQYEDWERKRSYISHSILKNGVLYLLSACKDVDDSLKDRFLLKTFTALTQDKVKEIKGLLSDFPGNMEDNEGHLSVANEAFSTLESELESYNSHLDINLNFLTDVTTKLHDALSALK